MLKILGWYINGSGILSCKKWKSLISCFYGSDGGFGSSLDRLGGRGVWCDIISAYYQTECNDPTYKKSFQVKVSNGMICLFWYDAWCSVGIYLSDFYHVFMLLTPFNIAKSVNDGFVSMVFELEIGHGDIP